MANVRVTPVSFAEWFEYHPATEETGPLHDNIRQGMGETAKWLDDLLIDSPEKTLALRKLQEAMMFANATVAFYGAKPEE